MQVWSLYVLQLSVIPHLLTADSTGIKYSITVFSRRVLKNLVLCYMVIPIQIPSHIINYMILDVMIRKLHDMTNWDWTENYIV